MAKTPNSKNRDFSLPRELYVGSNFFPFVVGKSGNYTIFSPTRERLVEIRYTGHHLMWSWKITGNTARKPVKTVRMKNWLKRIYDWNGTKIVLNPNTLELWLRSRYYNPTRKASSVMRMVGANWSKADKAAREFSTFAQIAVLPNKSEHPFDIQHAHLVMTTKEFNPILEPMSKIKDDVGLQFDKSHPGQPEFVGKKSVEGAAGAEWFFTKFPEDMRALTESNKAFAQNLELHMEVLREIRDAVKQWKRK